MTTWKVTSHALKLNRGVGDRIKGEQKARRELYPMPDYTNIVQPGWDRMNTSMQFNE